MGKGEQRARIFKLFAAVLCACFLLGSSTAVWADGGKAVRIKPTFTAGEKTDSYFGVSFDFTKKGKVGKKNLFSGKFIIPKSALKKHGDVLFIIPEISCYRTNGSLDGSLVPSSAVAVVKGKNKYEAFLMQSGVLKAAGEKVSLKASSKELTITVNHFPLYPDDEEISRKTTYVLSPTVWFLAGVEKKVKTYIDTDSVTLQAAKKHTSTFDKKDYSYLHGMTDDGYPVDVKLVNR